ncbi:energy-coupling factor ABC transporter ATP-binding protein [Candidatus Babeliales bacterium]|nr:energy-coupling factor ABC transporter ATP-binding protein [Candidatus Babeliales bacterium]
MTYALEIKNLNFKFAPQAPDFFKDLTVSFEKGRIHFIRGFNGAGKSTLFRLLRGKLEKQELVEGTVVVESSVQMLATGKEQYDALNTINMVQQKFDVMLADQLSFEQNLRLANLPSQPGLAALPAHKPVPAFVERFGIDIKKPVHLLSGGQRQILAILMALQKSTNILLLDEPTAALDEQNAEMVMSFLHDLVQTTGLTVLIICHDRELVMRYAQQSYFELVVDAQGVRSVVVQRFQE